MKAIGLGQMSLLRSWWLAIRPKTLPLGVATAMAGALPAWVEGVWDELITLWSLGLIVVLQVMANLANDYGDAIHGADSSLREGPLRMVASGQIHQQQMRWALLLVSICCMGCGFALINTFVGREGLEGLHLVGVWGICIVLGLVAIWAAFAYTAGEKPYGYRGLGDVAVWLFFGLLAVCGQYFFQTASISLSAFLVACAHGFWCAMVLNVNNIRDISTDKVAGKLTIAVKLGKSRAKYYHVTLAILAAVCWNIWLLTYAVYPIFWIAVLWAMTLYHIRLLWIHCDSVDLNRLLVQWVMLVLLWYVLLWIGSSSGVGF